MITNYDNYINENKKLLFADSIINYISNFISKNTNVDIIKRHEYEVDIFLYPEESLSFNYSSINHTQLQSQYNFIINSVDLISFDDINKYKKYIKNYFNKYYDNRSIYNIEDLESIPVYNINDYSQFIYNIITNNNKLISQLKYIEEYLNDDIKNKLKHFMNASKFDLI